MKHIEASGSKSLISVVVPVHNGERYLAEALASVLAQPYRPLEVVVVDDGSTDSSADIVQHMAPEIRYTYQPKCGLGAARNRGVELARGEFLGFLDADDLWLSTKLDLQLATFREYPTLEAVFGTMQQFYSPDVDTTIQTTHRVGAEISDGYHPNTMLIRHDAFLRIGLFETGRRFGEFMEWFGRASDRRLRYHHLPDILAKRRIHGANMSILENRVARRDYAEVIKAMLDRRRSGDSSVS